MLDSASTPCVPRTTPVFAPSCRARSFRLAAVALAVVLAAGLSQTAAQPPDRASGVQRTARFQNPAAPASGGANPFKYRVPAPSLDGGTEWLNTAGPLDLKDLRGKFVLLDFWTYCCINCMHILPELKKLEQKYERNLVVIGVHSAKFATEKDSKNIAEAIKRYEIEHPVVNDANHVIWNSYEVTSWPSLRLIDPEGNLVGVHSGEIEFEALDPVFAAGVAYYRGKGLLNETLLRFDLEQFKAEPTPLRYPGKILADEPNSRLYIADSNHNRIVVATLDGSLVETIGSGAIGQRDGNFETAQFNKPQGLALRGSTLYVADTENHLLRKIDLENKTVVTIAGIGRQSRFPWPGVNREDPNAAMPKRFAAPPRETALASPWDLALHGDSLYVAMAGPHQIWRMPLDESEIGVYAGNGREDIVDGRLLPRRPYGVPAASFAQPSGLAIQGDQVYVADSEGSSIRAVPLGSGDVRTVVGTAHLPFNRLFTFGDIDGKGNDVRLQHALGVVAYRDALYIADTYNHKIKRLDVGKKSVATVAGDAESGKTDNPPRFHEPAGIAAAAGKLFVADTNNHLIRTIDLDGGNRVATLEIRGLTPPSPPKSEEDAKRPYAGAPRIDIERAEVQPQDGKVRLDVRLTLPVGYKINPDAPMRYRVDVDGDEGPIDRSAVDGEVVLDRPSAKYQIELPLAQPAGRDLVRVSLIYYYCEDKKTGLCMASSVAWNVPLEISPTASRTSVVLPLTVE